MSFGEEHSNGRCVQKLTIVKPRTKSYTIYAHRIYGEENFWPVWNSDASGLAAAAREFAQMFRPQEAMEILVAYEAGSNNGIAQYLIEPILAPQHKVTKV